MKVNKAILRPIVLGVSQLLIMALPVSTFGGPIIIIFNCLDFAEVSGVTGPAYPGGAGIPVTFVGQGQVSGEKFLNALTFNSFQMTGFSPQLGHLTFSLDPTRSSTGVLVSEDDQDGGVTNTNRFFVRITTEVEGVSLISINPHVIVASISSFPTTATYHHIEGDVDFYVEGDPQQRTVFTLQDATVNVRPIVNGPAVSEWGLGSLALLLVSGVALKFGRRRAAA